jgi:hypothetical protein
MTAIVSMYTDEGFFIGADGRRVDSDTGMIAGDTVKKLFSVRVGGRDRIRLVYAWSGNTMFQKFDGTVFSLKVATDNVLMPMDPASVNTFSDFCRAFCDGLYSQLTAFFGAKLRGKSEIARVFFAAYFDGLPCAAEINVNVGDRGIQLPEIEKLGEPLVGGFGVFSGSESAYEIFKADLESSPRDASKLIRNYIELCFIYSDKTGGVNPIGGHIHIGRLTPKGFSWVESPIY